MAIGVQDQTSHNRAGCDPVDIPYVMDFENASIPALPECTSGENLGSGNNWTVANHTSNGFNGKVLRYQYSSSAADAWFFTQGVNLEAGTNYEISYKYGNNSTSYTEKLKVAMGTSPSAADMTQVLEDHPNINQGTAQTNGVFFNVPTDGVYYFGFNVYSAANQFYLYVDDIHVGLAPTCVPVSGLAVDAVTENSADVSWTPGQGETEWQVIYGELGFDPTTAGQTITVNANPEATLTGLESSTEYEFYVIAVCGIDEESAMAGPKSFLTVCSSTGIPYIQNFESAEIPEIPYCTYKENAGQGNDWETYAQNGNGFTSKVLRYKYNTSNPANAWFFTQGIELEAGETYEISYTYGNNSTSYTEKMKVAFGTVPTATSMTTELADHPSINTAQPVETASFFVVPSDGVYYFGFNAYSGTNQFYLYLDNIKIDLAPTCVPVSDLTATNVSSDSVDLSWTAGPGQGETEWKVIYGEEGFDPETEGLTVTVEDDPEVTLTGLTDATIYEFYVVAVCGVGDESAMAGPGTFTTTCLPTTVPYNLDFEEVTIPELPLCTSKENAGAGNDWKTANRTTGGFNGQVLQYSWNSSNPGNAWFYTNGIHMEAGTTYEISYKYGNGSTTWSEKMKVAFGTSPDHASMTNALADHPNITGGNATTETIYFTVPADDIYYFGFNAYSIANQLSLYLDDINIVLAPTCLPVSDLSVDGATPYTADISWTAGQDETEWEVIYGPIGFDPLTAGETVTVTGTPETTLVDLDDATEYDFYVRAVCAVDDSSLITGPVNFITACVPVSVPYVLDFEQPTPPALPVCTSAQNMGSGNQWETANVNGPGFQSRVLRYKYHTTQAANTWFFTKGVELEAGVEYRISYRYGNNSNTLSEKMKVAYGASAAASAMTNDLADYSDINGNTDFQERIIFTVAADGVYYFGFNAYSDANQHFLYLDDIEVIVAPDCDPATDVTVSNITYNSATVTWTESATAVEGYKVEVYLQGEDPTTDTPLITRTVASGITTTTINGLEEDTSYDLYVVTECGEDARAYSDVVNFTTINLGVNENDLTNISYFPNPVSDQLTITAAGKVDTIVVINLLGQTVMQVQPKSSTIVLDMSSLPEGTYILRVNNGDAVSSFKVVKK